MDQAKQTAKIEELIHFINQSPTAWHAVANLKDQLIAYHFEELHFEEAWSLAPGKRYFVTFHDSTLAAFIVPKQSFSKACILGTHTDSPALKLKPNPEFAIGNMTMLGIEVYGSPLLSSWLNRDLGIAGRIFYRSGQDIHQSLINIDYAPLTIPQLAPHLDRGVNESGLILNKQSHLSALATLKDEDHDPCYLEGLLKESVPFDSLLSHDLFLYPLENASFLGKHHEMVAGPRLDNLSSVHAAATGLISTKEEDLKELKIAVFWDSEEVGSATAQGAESPFLPHLIERIMLGLKKSREDYLRLLSHSFCVSVDLAHALNPNYIERHEKFHQPLLNKGVVIKYNAQQRYASSAMTAALIVDLCEQLNFKCQKFVVRSDMPCGSTIGPITATLTGIPTVDIGIPQLSMHSIREVIGCQDHLELCQLLSIL